MFEELYWVLMQVEVDEIVRRTGCKKPCSYSEYKFMNSNPREIVVAEFPKDQIGFALWAVSQNTKFEEEVHLNLKRFFQGCLFDFMLEV